MGEVIRANASVDDILKDVRTAATKASVKDGPIAEESNKHLVPVLAMVDSIDGQLAAATAALGPLVAAVSAENSDADAEIQHIYDDLWNVIGRPQHDPYLSVLFPGGTAFYTDGDTPNQPTRMEILAKLFDSKLHPKLTAAQHATYAERVRDAATGLKTALGAAKDPAALVEQLSRVRTSLGRVAQFELTKFKRALKNEGFTESQIHDIIPDRPTTKKAAPKGAGPQDNAPPAPPAVPK